MWWCVTCVACGYTAESAQKEEVARANWDLSSIIMASDEEIHAEAVAEHGSESAVTAIAEEGRRKMLATVGAHMGAVPPTPEPSVMRDYIARLTCFFIDNPKWIALAEEARGYIGVLEKQPVDDAKDRAQSAGTP